MKITEAQKKFLRALYDAQPGGAWLARYGGDSLSGAHLSVLSKPKVGYTLNRTGARLRVPTADALIKAKLLVEIERKETPLGNFTRVDWIVYELSPEAKDIAKAAGDPRDEQRTLFTLCTIGWDYSGDNEADPIPRLMWVPIWKETNERFYVRGSYRELLKRNFVTKCAHLDEYLSDLYIRRSCVSGEPGTYPEGVVFWRSPASCLNSVIERENAKIEACNVSLLKAKRTHGKLVALQNKLAS